MRGFDGYFSCSRFSSGTARPYSFFARSVAPLSVSSAMWRTLYRSLKLDPLQRLLRGCRGGRVRVTLDAFVERLLRQLQVAALLQCDARFVGGVGGFVLIAVV